MSTEEHNEHTLFLGTPRGRGRLVSVEPRRRAANRLEEHLVSLLAPHSADAERYRMLRNDVETFRKNDNLQVLAVTSPLAGDGKTTTAINLAASLAQSTAARVLLADVDLRRPSVARQVGLDGSRHSLVDALVGPGLTLEDMGGAAPPIQPLGATGRRGGRHDVRASQVVATQGAGGRGAPTLRLHRARHATVCSRPGRPAHHEVCRRSSCRTRGESDPPRRAGGGAESHRPGEDRGLGVQRRRLAHQLELLRRIRGIAPPTLVASPVAVVVTVPPTPLTRSDDPSPC